MLSFSLFDCKASDGSDEVALYNDHCPIEEIKNKINLKWNDYASFDISVFQMASSNRLVPNCTNCIYIYMILNNFSQFGTYCSLTFSCSVRVFIEESELPEPCSNNNRKRRSTGDNTKSGCRNNKKLFN